MKDFIALVRGAIYSFLCNNFRKNICVGAGLRIYKRPRITGQGNLRIGNDCTIDGIAGDTSQYVCIDLRAANSAIEIGSNVTLHAARLAAKFEIHIGDGVSIDESAVIDTDFHTIDRSRKDPEHEEREKCKVFIGDGVSIGARSIVMKGVTIGDGAVILPGSVVIRSVAPNVTVCGNPARPFQERNLLKE